MTELSVGGALAPLLEARGVTDVFGIPGNHTVELYRGLAQSTIRHITTRHEQGAGFMADGYARATGRPGVCLLISGPGLLNAATALGQALADSVPVLAIVAVGARETLGAGLGTLHELPEQLQTAAGFSRLALRVSAPEEFPVALERAFELFATARPGPVVIEIPTDVQKLTFPGAAEAHKAVQGVGMVPAADPGLITDCAQRLHDADAPLLVLGGGAVGAADECRQLAVALDAPVIATSNAKGIVPPGHPLHVGGSPSLPGLQAALAEADCVLAIGTEFGETDYDLLFQGAPAARSGSLIRVDIDAAQLKRNRRADVAVCADAAAFVPALRTALVERPERGGAARAATLRDGCLREAHWHAEMAQFFATLGTSLGDVCVVGDSTRPTYYATWQYEPQRPRRYFHSVTGFGTLGYSIPAAMGAAVGLDEPVLCLIGDGGAQFTLTEFATAVQERLPVCFLVWANAGYEEITNSMIGADVSTDSTMIGGPDYVALAAAYGLPSATPRDHTALASALAEAAAREGPTLVLVRQEDFLSQPSGEWY
ncbi:MAG: 5-guanidino-2-oxopentanoate decarboxylase [Pseudomonadota bacterium]